MTKLGDEYQDIVALVRSALAPHASVKIGQWVQGPDGRRDIDVEVRGDAGGREHFILVECKDWRRPVGIETIDALESKRHDLSADLAVIYSNSGFTNPALRKARRVGLQAFSALKEGDKRIRVTLAQELIVRALSIDSYAIRLSLAAEFSGLLASPWGPLDVTVSGLPLVNWLCSESAELLRLIDSSSTVKATYMFIQEQDFLIRGQTIGVRGIDLTLNCTAKWLSQEVQAGVTLGHYDHVKKSIVIPSEEAYVFGPVDQEKWQEVPYGWPDGELEPNSFRLRMTLLRPIVQTGDGEGPPLSERVATRHVTHEIVER